MIAYLLVFFSRYSEHSESILRYACDLSSLILCFAMFSTSSENMPRNATPMDDANDKQATPKEPLIPQGVLPSYLSEAFGDLYAEDGLLVLGRGLGLLPLLASFVRFYGDVEDGHASMAEDGKNAPKIPPLVFVLGLKEVECNALVSILETWGTPPALLPQMITNESGQAKDRSVLYARGGVFCITSRILIVDLLTNIANPRDIEGLLVAHAEHVTDQSTEAFILRIFRTQKQFASPDQPGFVKALSDEPETLLSGFAKVDKVLKALHVRRLFLFPRFHSSIADELDQQPPRVEELYQELSPRMKEIQAAIAACVMTVVRELKGVSTKLEWNDTDLSIENCVTKAFDQAISRQLEPEWHRLQPSTKQLVQDLRTLRSLFQYLIQYDCVSFWKLINSIKSMSAASRNPSMWLLSPAGNMLFSKAKERMYQISLPKATKKVPTPVAKLHPTLEENPKWQLLTSVIQEIREECEKKSNSPSSYSATVLVMVKDQRTLDNLRSYLVDGKQRTMTLRWLNYLESYNDRSRSVTKTNGGTSAISEESRLLLEEEGRARRFLFGGKNGTKAGETKRPLNQVPSYVRKRRRIAEEKGRSDQTMKDTEDRAQRAVLDEAVEETEHDLESHAARRPDWELKDDDREDNWYEATEPDCIKVVLKSYSSMEGDAASLLLHDLCPSHIILYDADVSFVRSIEIHSSLHDPAMDQLRVYFMIFEASAEEKMFMKALEREQNAFERLIHHKKTMPLPVQTLNGTTQEMQHAMANGHVAGSYAGGALPLAFDTRTGKGKAKSDGMKRDIAVDVREFRSALPSILHQGGMRLAPVTLTVGDFVLSNVHCVERKSISDLFGSFASGRLFTQAESMSKYYKCPCLLIEFDPAKSFSLQNSNELGVEIRTDSTCSKMALLTMHFPQLRILWSKSPHETLRIFRELKASHDEVDVDKAVELGRNESEDAFKQEMEGDEDDINEAARDMLLRMPGVNVHNARKIMKECDSLVELVNMSRDRLREVAGPVTGQKLFTFFRQKMGTT